MLPDSRASGFLAVNKLFPNSAERRRDPLPRNDHLFFWQPAGEKSLAVPDAGNKPPAVTRRKTRAEEVNKSGEVCGCISEVPGKEISAITHRSLAVACAEPLSSRRHLKLIIISILSQGKTWETKGKKINRKQSIPLKLEVKQSLCVLPSFADTHVCTDDPRGTDTAEMIANNLFVGSLGQVPS